MNKKLMSMILIGAMSTGLFAGCQPKDDKVVEADAVKEIVIEVPQEDNVDQEKLNDAVIGEVFDWTDEDEITYQAFIKSADEVALIDLKAYVDKRIQDAPKMMVDHFVAYYEKRLNEAQYDLSDLFFEEGVQEALIETFDYDYFSQDQLSKVDNPEIVEKIAPVLSMGYKIETTEGMYYPIVDYNILYTYEDYVTQGVKQYLQLKKRESDIMAYSDAAVVVPWSELGKRLLMAEAVLDATLPELMEKNLIEDFKWTMMSFTLGTNNTPVFAYDDKTIVDTEMLESFKELAEIGGPISRGIMKPYLKVLEEENYTGTDKVYETINGLLEELLK